MSSHNKPNAPDTSPPPYSETEAALIQQPVQQPPTLESLPNPPFSHYPQNQPLFGPTPLNDQPVLPYSYYDPRSPHSISQADTRARLRFIVGLLWAIATWCLIAYLVASEVVEYTNDTAS